MSNKNIIKCVMGERVPAHRDMVPYLKVWPQNGSPLPEKEHNHYDLKELKELQNQKSVEYTITPDILFPLIDMRNVAQGRNTLRAWQKKVLYP